MVYQVKDISLTLSLSREAESKTQKEMSDLVLNRTEKQTSPQKNTAQHHSFEWSHFRIAPTDSKVRVTSVV